MLLPQASAASPSPSVRLSSVCVPSLSCTPCGGELRPSSVHVELGHQLSSDAFEPEVQATVVSVSRRELRSLLLLLVQVLKPSLMLSFLQF